jgi:uncharacterized protein YndB with AHSA1/START domain
MKLGFEVQSRIQKPIAEVFDAVYNPTKLSGYFTNGGASAPLDEGMTVEWAFEDTPGEKMSFPVVVKKVVPNELIVIGWEGAPGLQTTVEIHFIDNGPEDTIVKISETGWRETQEDLNSSYMNCMGWMQMICCMKAYTEYGIDLRKGAFGGLYDVNEKGTGGDKPVAD